MMLQRDAPDDFVLATGRSSSVRDLIDGAATGFGFDIESTATASTPAPSTGGAAAPWSPSIQNSTGLPRSTRWLAMRARPRPSFFGWEAKTSLEGLIQMMVKADYDRVKTGIIRC